VQTQASNGHGLHRAHERGLARLELLRPPRNPLDPNVMAAPRDAMRRSTPTPMCRTSR
jgi:hypothetical protein